MHTFQPFIDLLTRRHPRPSFFSVVLSFLLSLFLSRYVYALAFFVFFLFFFSIGDIVSKYQKSQPRGSRIIERATVAASISRIHETGSANFVITRDKGEPLDDDRFAAAGAVSILARRTRRRETFIESYATSVSIVNYASLSLIAIIKISGAFSIGPKQSRRSSLPSLPLPWSVFTRPSLFIQNQRATLYNGQDLSGVQNK